MWGPFQPVQRKGSDTGTSLHKGKDKYADDNYEDDGDDGDSDEDDDDDDEDNDNLRLIYGTNRKSQMQPTHRAVRARAGLRVARVCAYHCRGKSAGGLRAIRGPECGFDG